MGTLVLAGRYEILEKIGDGGMAVVYRARDKQLNRFVAIKILKKEFITDQTFVDNFIREARAAASLLHPNIVTIYDTGKDRDIYYIVMEYVEGRALSEVISAEAPLDYKRCIRISKQIASALSLAHRNNIIHRDVKPHNILITPDGTAKITDFGIAKAVSDGTIISDNGVIMGSVHYFSPEQSRGQYVDEKSDIYSLGIVLYEMITARVPFDADNPVTIAIMHMNDVIIPPSRLVRGVPPGLDQIVLKATAKYQSDRFKNIDEMYKALDNVNFITGIIDDPEIAGYVKPTNMVEETPGQGYSSAAYDEPYPDDLPAQGADDSGDAYDEPDYARTASGRSKAYDEEDEDEYEDDKKPGFFAALFGGADDSKNETNKSAGGEKKQSKLTDRQKLFLIVAAVVVAVVVSFPLSKVIVGMYKPEMVTVPNVVGMNVDAATTNLKAVGFSVEVEIEPLPYVAPQTQLVMGEDTDSLAVGETPTSAGTTAGTDVPGIKEGQVTKQDPSADSVVKKGTTVKLKVAGPPEAPSKTGGDELSTEIRDVPDLVGKSKASAEYAIAAAGFKVVVSYENSELPVDQVIAQSPKKGEKAPGNSPIIIVISLGPKEVSVSVPNVGGKTLAEAQATLTQAKLKVATIDAYSDSVPQGAVISQNPSAGAAVKEGSTVTLTISAGPALVKAPSLVGKTEAQAQAELAALGLVYAKGGEVEDAANVGKVVSQTPGAGSDVAKGSTVSCVIGKAPVAPPTPTITGVSPIIGADVVSASGGGASYTAEALGTGGHNRAVTWSLSATSGINATIDGNGNLTVEPSATGSIVITATAAGDGSRFSLKTVTII